MAQSGIGKLRIFEHFFANEDPIALTAVPRVLGDFRVVGQGMAEVDSGFPQVTGALNGVVRGNTTNEDVHSIALETNVCFDVALNGTLIAEARVQFENLDTKAFFMGFTDIEIASSVPDIQTDLITASAGTTLSLVASDLVGFYLDAELTEDEMWHGVYKGGSTTGPTLSTTTQLGVDNVAAEWDVIRLEVDPNGTARWFVNGALKQTVAGASSTTVDLKFMIGVGAKGAAIETVDIDYILLEANMDWTV